MTKDKLRILLKSQNGVFSYRKICINSGIENKSALYDFAKGYEGSLKDITPINEELLRIKKILEEYFN